MRRALLALVLAAGFAGAAAPSASAVTGAEARNNAYYAQASVCGTFWYKCMDVTAPYPSCYGAGGGTWNCYGGIKERHRVTWHWRSCSVYTYVAWSGATSPHKSC